MLERVTACAALVVDGAWFANVSVAGATAATGIVPVPVSVTLIVGLTGLLLTRVSDVVRAPTEARAGWNVTVMVQVDEPAGHVVPHELVWPKSAALPPEIPRLVIFSTALPVLDSATVCEALVVVTIWFPNASAPGARPATGALPVPVRGTLIVGRVGSALTMASDAGRAPAVAGVKVKLMVQLPVVAARVAPHVVVRA